MLPPRIAQAIAIKGDFWKRIVIIEKLEQQNQQKAKTITARSINIFTSF